MAGLRTILPFINLCGASFILAIVIAAATGDWGLLIPVWWNVWLAAICLGWLMGGLFAVFGMISILVILPVTFYQSALGGAMIPVAAAPEWLRVIGEMIPFDTLGAAYRGAIHGAGFGLPLIWLGGAACVGLVLIWSAGLISARKS
jgi:ABC-type multidrug transport system permease subunit